MVEVHPIGPLPSLIVRVSVLIGIQNCDVRYLTTLDPALIGEFGENMFFSVFCTCAELDNEYQSKVLARLW